MTATATARSAERGMSNLARQAGVLAGRNLRLALTRSAVVAMVVTPLVFYLGFLAVFRKLFQAHGIDYAQYLPPAIVVMWISFTAVSAALLFARDRRTGMLGRLRSMPVNRAAVIAARLATDTLRALISVAVVLAAAYLTGFRLSSPAGAVGFVLLAVALVVVVTLGTSAAGLSSTEPEATASALQLPTMPLLMLSSAFTPVHAFPGWLQPIVRISPVTAIIDSLRALAGGGSPGASMLWAGAWLAAFGALFGWLAFRAFGRAT
jgi:ABC-2 type transport system permease protein